MNKEFRVWDATKKQWVKKFMIDPTGRIEVFLINDPNNVILQQYTGLLDKNGVKIFEGDIIRHGCTTQEYESVVAYKAPSFIAKTFFYCRGYYFGTEVYRQDVMWEKKGIEAFNDGWYMGDRQFTGGNYLEVIGNIFENPELL